MAGARFSFPLVTSGMQMLDGISPLVTESKGNDNLIQREARSTARYAAEKGRWGSFRRGQKASPSSTLILS